MIKATKYFEYLNFVLNEGTIYSLSYVLTHYFVECIEAYLSTTKQLNACNVFIP